jgi:hypothetical protein
VFTSGIVWVIQQRRIALFYTGAKHAGENLAGVLRERSGRLPPIHMCDYKYDEQARVQRLSAEERLRFHQEHSKPVMDKLQAWLEAQFAERKVEPNSGLGKTISYLLNHWQRLTLFLRQAGAPLDNNLVERSLKKAILHRKNSLFYKTGNRARMGDLYMSLIHTCELNGANPFDYLTELQRHAEELRQNPAAWMPWNYHETLAAVDSG